MNISLTLPDTQQSVSRPIIFDIISQIQDITKIPKETDIYYAGDIQKILTPSTSIDSTDERFAKFNTNNIIFIEVEEDYDKDALATTAVTRNEHVPVFLDTDLDIKLAPVYATTDVRINFKYRCVSKTQALRWRDDMRMRLSQLRDINIHSVTYHYLLPLELLIVLKAIHETKELTLPFNETYQQYITRNTTERLTVLGDLINQDARLAISEKQARIVGIYDWDGIPDKPEREDNGLWTITFSYKFSYEKPIACNFKYPIIAHNTLLPKYYTYFDNKSYDLYQINKYRSLSFNGFSGFESDTTMDNRVTPDYMLRLPEFDDYQIPSQPVGTGSVFLALCTVDPTDNVSLFNLNDLGDVVIDKEILKFIIESEQPYICSIYKSIFHLSLYRNNHLTSASSLTCDTSLNVKATTELNLRNQHRVRLSIVTDLTLLTREAIERLRKYPKALVRVISAMNEILKNHPDFQSYGDRSYITELEFSPIYALITGYALNNGTGTTRGNYYGDGLAANGWPNKGYKSDIDIFRNIDPRMLENYRNNRINMNTVEVAGIIAINK